MDILSYVYNLDDTDLRKPWTLTVANRLAFYNFPYVCLCLKQDETVCRISFFTRNDNIGIIFNTPNRQNIYQDYIYNSVVILENI